MSHSILTPEIDIPAAIDEIISPRTKPEDAQAIFGEVVDQLEWEGDEDRFRYVHRSPVEGKLILPLVRNPYAALVTEMEDLAPLSKARTISNNTGGQDYDFFVTRDEQEEHVDATYRIIQGTKQPLITVETLLQGQLDEPCMFKIANGALKVMRREWNHGMMRDKEESVAPGTMGEKLVLGLVGSTLLACHKQLVERTPEQRRVADEDARLRALGMLIAPAPVYLKSYEQTVRQ